MDFNESFSELSSDIPKLSIRSALPTLLETDLFPCFAIFTPRDARIKELIVDTFNVDLESPPVPHKSNKSKLCGGAISIFFRRTLEAKKISSAEGFLIFRAVKKDAA